MPVASLWLKPTVKAPLSAEDLICHPLIPCLVLAHVYTHLHTRSYIGIDGGKNVWIDPAV